MGTSTYFTAVEDSLQRDLVLASSPHCASPVSAQPSENDIIFPALNNIDTRNATFSSNLDTFDTKYIDHAIMTFDSNGGVWSFENCSLSVPEGAIPKETIIVVEIGVSICTQLTALLPLGLQSVSPIIQLCVLNDPKFKFTKPVTIQIEHHLDITNHSDVKSMNLHFLKSLHGLPCFHTTDGKEEFTAGTHHGTLAIDHFCSFCIAADITSIDASKVYYYVMSAIPRRVITSKWEIVYCITLYTCSRVSYYSYPHMKGQLYYMQIVSLIRIPLT